MLEIDYKNNNVKKYLENLRLVQKEFGLQIAKKIAQRLDELRSFNNVFLLLTSGIDNPHLLIGDLEGCIGWDITGPVRFIIKFCESFSGYDMKDSKYITKVVIEGVRDYHGGNKKWLIN